MDEHMKKSLFKDEASEVEPDSKENDEEIDNGINSHALIWCIWTSWTAVSLDIISTDEKKSRYLLREFHQDTVLSEQVPGSG